MGRRGTNRDLLVIGGGGGGGEPCPLFSGNFDTHSRTFLIAREFNISMGTSTIGSAFNISMGSNTYHVVRIMRVGLYCTSFRRRRSNLTISCQRGA